MRRGAKAWQHTTEPILKVPELGLIDAADVKQLSDDQLTAVCNQLIAFELRKVGLPPTVADITHAMTVRDGGLDARVHWDGDPDRAGVIPARLTGFQYKATAMGPQKCADELCTQDGNDLKPAVRRLLESDGWYILIAGAEDLTVEMVSERLRLMRETVAKYLGEGARNIEVWGASTIAAWIASYIPAIAYVSNCVGRTYAHELRSVEEWSRQKAYANRYVELESTKGIAAELKAKISEPAGAFRLDGLPGLGKTRLALETVKTLESSGVGCVYIDVARAGVADQVRGMIMNWCRHSSAGTLIVDNCPAELHEALEDEVHGSNISLLTIDYRGTRMPGGTALARLPRLEHDEIRAIVEAEFPGAFSPMGLDRIVSRADGWPLIAVRLARAVREHGERAEDLPGERFMARILGIEDNDRDARQVIRTFEHVGFEAPFGDHLEYLRVHLCQPMEVPRFDELVQQFRQRGILVEVGSLLRVTPPPMAVQLAAEWIQSYPVMRERLFDPAMPRRLVEYLCRQFAHLDTVTEAREIAGKLLAVDGLIGDAQALSTNRGARIFRALSKVDPSAALAALTRIFMRRERDDLLAYKDGRRDVIFALEYLIYPKECFVDAVRVLAQLAAAENESIANNATGVLAARFVPIGAQTEASSELRLQVIDELIRSGDDAKVLVAATCVAAALRSDSGVGSTWIEPPNIGRPVTEWRPSAQEAAEYRSALTERGKQIALLPGNAGEVIRRAVAASIRHLVAREELAELDDVVRTMNRYAPQPWKEAIDHLRAALQYEAKGKPEVRRRVEGILAAITPTSLPERVRLIVTDPPVDFEERDGAYIDLGERRAAEFAAEVVRDGRLKDVLPLVVRGNQQKGIEFGQGLLAATDYDDRVLQELITQTAATPVDERNIGPLAGGLVSLAQHDRARYDRTMDEILERGLLLERLAQLSAIVRPTDADIERLLLALREKRIDAQQFEALAYGSALESCSRETVVRLLDTLLEQPAYHVVYFIASMQTVSHRERWKFFSPYIKAAIIHMDIARQPLNGIHDWSVIEDVKRLLAAPENEELAASLATDIFVLAKGDIKVDASSRLSEFVPSLFAQYRAIAWNMFLQVLDTASDIERYRLMGILRYLPAGAHEHRSALDDLPIDDLLAACWRLPEFLPAFVAQTSSLFSTDTEGQLQPSPQANMLLEHFAQDEHVRGAFEGNLISFASVGPRGPHYQARVEFTQRLPDFGKPVTRIWLAEIRDRLVAMAAEQSKRDMEFQGGAW